MNYIKIYLSILFIFLPFQVLPAGTQTYSLEAAEFVHPSEQQSLLTSITKKTIELRYHTEIERILLDNSHGNKLERSSEIEKQLYNEIVDRAPDFTMGTSHIDSIAHFLQSQLGASPEQLQIVDENRVTRREFVILDKKNKLVVKVFPMIPGSEFKLIHEISGNAAFRSLNLEQSKTVKFLAIGKYTYEQSPYIMLAMELAEGDTIKKSLVKNWNQYLEEQDEQALASSKDLLYKLGQSIGEVHLKGSKIAPLNYEYQFAVKEYYKKLIDDQLLQYEQNGGEHTFLFRELFTQLLERYGSSTQYFAPYHGDAHLENFLYDPLTNTITIIDSVRAHVSVDSENLPLSDKFYMDICRLESSLIKNLLKLTNHAFMIEQLSPSLIEGWRSVTEGIIDTSRYDLEHYYTALTKMAPAVKWEQIPNLEERAVAKARLEFYEQELLEKAEEILFEQNVLAQ